MNTSHENHDPADSNDLPDRLLDVALAEFVGGATPPDLSARIAAATSRQPAAQPAPAASLQAPRTRQDRAFWTRLALAAMLLISVTVVLFSNSQRAVNKTLGAPELAELLHDHADSTQWKQPSSIEHSVVKPAPTAADHVDKELKVARDLKSTLGTVSVAEMAALPPSPAQSLSAYDGTRNYFYNVPSTDGVAARSEFGWGFTGENTRSDLGDAIAENNSAPTGTSAAKGMVAREHLYRGVEPSLPAPVTVPGQGETLHFYNEQDSVNKSVAATIDDVAHFQQDQRELLYDQKHWKDFVRKRERPSHSGDKYGRGATPTTTQLVDEIRKLQRQGKPTEELKKELGKLSERSVDLGAQTAEGISPDSSGDKYTQIVENPFIKAEGGDAVSTLSIDVDTASYANVRQFLLQMNQLPPADAVRIEELVNYFHYDYAPPKAADEAPFAAHVEVASCPWAPEHRLARIGIKGREMDRTKRPQSNLVFLVDVSGSMNEPAKLPLVVYGLQELTRELGENDHIAIVVYAGTEGVVLPSTSGNKQDTILAALGKLQAGGSTAGGAGIQLAYQIAEDNFIKGGTNRVILCTDGDFNVGVTNTADLQRLVEKKAKDTGVFLSTLGFGRGNLNDAMMLAISDHGNGNYHYIDNRTEARRVLVEEMTGTLVTIAKDVKIQVEFNPAQVGSYRLIGYEKRALRTEDFNNDKKDAGEIGAGHTVTALYEIVPAGNKTEIAPVDDLKYQKRKVLLTDSNATDSRPLAPAETSRELLTLKMRYKAPDGNTSKKLEWPVTDDGKSFSAASGDTKFAASVAGFGLLLRNSQYKGNLTFAADIELAQGGIGEDPHGYRKEFVEMIRKAKELRHE